MLRRMSFLEMQHLMLKSFRFIPAKVGCTSESPFRVGKWQNWATRRVSTNGQDLAAQVAELWAKGCAKVYREKVSGAKTERPELTKLLRALDPGDVLIVTRLDRLARSTRDLLNVLDAVAQCGAGFRSLKDTWADTTTAQGRLMLTVLGGLAEFERELIRARTGEGRNRAKARGVKFRPPSQVDQSSAAGSPRSTCCWRDTG